MTSITVVEAQQYLYISQQYSLQKGPIEVQAKSDVEVSLKMIALSDIYDYPNLFSFNINDYPGSNDVVFSSMYPKGPLGNQWQSPFASLDGSQQAVIGWVKVRNGTTHILRMRDARIYLVLEGHEPRAALSSIDSVSRLALYFEQQSNLFLNNQPHGLISIMKQIPLGFFRWIVLSHRDSYKLINDLNREVLPGSSLEGMLVFPAVLSTSGAKISFFDVVTKTDAAGNPVERAQFDFILTPRLVGRWYDRENMYKTQSAPIRTAGSPSDQPAKPSFTGLWVGDWVDPEGKGQLAILLDSSGDSVSGVYCASSGKQSVVVPVRGAVKDSVLSATVSVGNTIVSRSESMLVGVSLVGHYSQESGKNTWDMSKGYWSAPRHAWSGPVECGPKGIH